MTDEVQAFLDFRRACGPQIPEVYRWAMAGALAIGALIGLVSGAAVGWMAGRRGK